MAGAQVAKGESLGIVAHPLDDQFVDHPHETRVRSDRRSAVHGNAETLTQLPRFGIDVV